MYCLFKKNNDLLTEPLKNGGKVNHEVKKLLLLVAGEIGTGSFFFDLELGERDLSFSWYGYGKY